MSQEVSVLPLRPALGTRLAESWRDVKTSAWLGWQIESNWASPLQFFIYSIARPLSTSLILVVMYLVVAHQPTSTPKFAYVYVGNAFFMFQGETIFGVMMAIIDDRENYEMLKYIYVSPVHSPLYLFGRTLARLATVVVAVTIMLGFGIFVLHIHIYWQHIQWGLLLPAMFLGWIGMMGIALILGGSMLMATRDAWTMPEAVQSTFFLLAGALFPINLLPVPLRAISLILPTTYWLEALRRALVGGNFTTTLQPFSDSALLGLLALSAGILGVGSLFVLRWCEHMARERGYIDRTSGD